MSASLTDSPQPARRGPLDAVFDRLVANSALLPARRYWTLKLVWKIPTVALLLGAGWLLVEHPGVTLGAVIMMAPAITVFVVFWAFSALLKHLFARGVDKHEKAIVGELRSALARLPEVRDAKIRYPVFRERGELKLLDAARIDLKVESDTATEPLVDHVVRLFWLSRLYPLKVLYLRDGTKAVQTVRFDRAVSSELRRRHGPRPYGPLPPIHP